MGTVANRIGIVNQASNLMKNLHPKNSDSWASIKESIEEDMYPTLHSYHLIEKLVTGKLTSWKDKVTKLRMTGKIADKKKTKISGSPASSTTVPAARRQK